MNIYFLRHGETEENSRKVYYGKRDISLNENGIRQCNSVGEMLKGIDFGKIYTSERKRTIETASVIFNGSRNDFISDRRINERCFGIFEGMTYDEIKAKYPEEWTEWERDWMEYALPGGENYIQFYDRVRSFIRELEGLDDGNILVVTHGGVIRAVYCVILGDMKLYWKFASRNADISVLKYEYGNWYIDSITHTMDGE